MRLFLEVVEHVNDGKYLFSIIPAGSTVIFSVPNFDSSAHVRHFSGIGEIMERYEKIIDFKAGAHVILPGKRAGNIIYLFSGKKE